MFKSPEWKVTTVCSEDRGSSCWHINMRKYLFSEVMGDSGWRRTGGLQLSRPLMFHQVYIFALDNGVRSGSPVWGWEGNARVPELQAGNKISLWNQRPVVRLARKIDYSNDIDMSLQTLGQSWFHLWCFLFKYLKKYFPTWEENHHGCVLYRVIRYPHVFHSGITSFRNLLCKTFIILFEYFQVVLDLSFLFFPPA